MATRLAMPSLGMVMTEGTIARWIADDGAVVAVGQPLLEIETDKLTHQVEAPAAGTLRRVAGEGSVLPVEGLIGWLLADGEEPPVEDDGHSTPPIPTAASAAPQTGDGGKAGMSAPTDRTTAEPPDPAGASGQTGASNTTEPGPAGPSREDTENGRRHDAGALSLGWPEPAVALGARPGPATLRADSPLLAAAPAAPVSPAARRLAREHGLDLGHMRGSGPGGRIVEADVRATLAGQPTGQAPADAIAPPAAAGPAVPSAAPTMPASDADRRIVARVPLTGMRRVIAERMTASLATGAQLTLTREVDASALVAARQARRSSLDAVQYDAFVVRALAAALSEQPALNAVIEGDQIVLLADVHVGVAVSVDGGLVVPVVRNAATRSLAEISRSIGDLVARARAGRLSPDDLAGGTVTITNLGGYQIDVFTPILNPPQSAILGIGRIAPRAVVIGEAIAVRSTVHLSLTFDHRVADGAAAALLLGRVSQLLGDPTWLRDI